MMKESNNSMAEALFYQIAAQDGRKGAGRKQAVVHYNDLIRHIGLDASHYQIADGSTFALQLPYARTLRSHVALCL